MTTDEISDILRRLVESYISKPDDLQIDVKEVPGAFYFRLNVNADDMRAMVGTNGSHVRALSAIVAAIGEGCGLPAVLTLLDPELRTFRKMTFDPVAPKRKFDSGPAAKLLADIIGAMGFGDHAIDVFESTLPATSKRPLALGFKITVRGSDDYARLIAPFNPGPNGPGETIIGSLGTLFRAYAAKEGVRFDIEVQQS